MRTIQRIVADAPDDDSGPWSILDAEDDDATLVLPVLWELHNRHGVKAITRGAARCIVQVRRAVPDCPPDFVWRYAMQYHVLRQRRETDFSDLDLQLAGGWWRDKSALESWRDLQARVDAAANDPRTDEERYQEALETAIRGGQRREDEDDGAQG